MYTTLHGMELKERSPGLQQLQNGYSVLKYGSHLQFGVHGMICSLTVHYFLHLRGRSVGILPKDNPAICRGWWQCHKAVARGTGNCWLLHGRITSSPGVNTSAMPSQGPRGTTGRVQEMSQDNNQCQQSENSRNCNTKIPFLKVLLSISHSAVLYDWGLIKSSSGGGVHERSRRVPISATTCMTRTLWENSEQHSRPPGPQMQNSAYE